MYNRLHINFKEVSLSDFNLKWSFLVVDLKSITDRSKATPSIVVPQCDVVSSRAK